MDKHERELYAHEKERARADRSKKWDERGKKFWSTFLFTENGKPKSGFLIYTFCLAIAFFAIYYASFYFLVDWLEPLVRSWPVWIGNLFVSLCCCAVGIFIGWFVHRTFSDKRLMLGTHIWLAFLAAASIIAMAVILGDAQAFGNFLQFSLWFIIIPAVLGLFVFYRLYKRDHVPEKGSTAEQEPEYKKYLRH